ncbi:FG-GAP repeat protein [Winkia sp. UMB3158]|uniref:FG-GAP repeat protein n=1 Tax=Winkia TaxID=2692118 RepID=UPI0008A65056|nr:MULTISPECIES: FG-GAP repeat protein [Winkia]MCG7302435.1 FG-GAP repeat protein [Winkia sp. ACRQY]MDK8341882.1 FG-GAP repeat protein [Winkia sp. UMB3164B]OFT37997.1 hypothetical protein HMPREF3163_07600 [Actinomyces sp. HMSC08A01]PLB79881.1 hypothetical protein CYJ21_09240 [Actinomyces sp. UMB0138]PMC93864.1 hypothetical protein CJ188_01070 [Actinomyces sp. UMB0918]
MEFARFRRGSAGIAAALLCATIIPAANAAEKPATGADSNLPKWSAVDGTRFNDVARRTDRVTYPDAGHVPAVGCDITGDDLADMIFTNPQKRKTYAVPYIPYGSDNDEVTRSIEEQNAVKTVSEEAEGYGLAAACLPDSTRLAVAAKNKIFIYSAGLKKAAEVEVAGIRAMASSGNRLAVASGHKLYFYDATGERQGKPLDLGANIEVVVALSDGTFALGMSEVGKVQIVEPRSGAITMTATGDADARFGAAITSTGDLNGDEDDDLAIGAPLANNETGAVALITDLNNDVKVDVTSTDDSPVTADGKSVGYLLRAPLRAHLGASLAWVDGGDKPGALVVGKPVDEEHTGALVISAQALNKNYNNGLGIDGIGEKYKLWLAGGDEKDDAGVEVGVMPRRGEDTLNGIFTVNSTGKVDVWTIDLTHQGEPKKQKIDPPYPAPEPEKRESAVQSLDTPEKKIWKGEFSSGLGSSLVKGQCDVTGDGKADIIAGMPTRSEWKFDPFYLDSTSTHGWLPNVTGGVQIIPGGTKGKDVPAADTIALNGPKETTDPGTDSSVGLSVACLGDTNGDGIADLAVNSHTMARAWVIYGGPHLAKVDLNNLHPDQGWWIDLPEYGSSPVQISRAGDVNEDGLADIAVTLGDANLARGEKGHKGALYIFAGKKHAANVDMKKMTPPEGAVVRTVFAPEGHFLSQSVPVGDVNGDGVVDWVLTDFQAEQGGGIYPGKAWLVYGSTEKEVQVAPGNSFELTMSPDASHRLGAGASVAPVGDVNSDGYNDFVIGYDGGQIMHQSEGGLLLVYGHKGQRTKVSVSVADGARNEGVRVVRGPAKNSGFGWAVDALPGKKKALIAVGAPTMEKDGRVFLFDTSVFKETPTTLPESVSVIRSPGEQARFGRALAFVGNVLEGPTLAIGADGVISEEGEGREGFANSAHVLAMRINPWEEEESSDSSESSEPADAEKPAETDQEGKGHLPAGAEQADESKNDAAPKQTGGNKLGAVNTHAQERRPGVGSTVIVKQGQLAHSGSVALLAGAMALTLLAVGTGIYMLRREH